MKKIISVLITMTMVFVLIQSVAAVISPSTDVEITDIILDDGTKLTDEQIDDYIDIIKEDDTLEPEDFGDDYEDYSILEYFSFNISDDLVFETIHVTIYVENLQSINDKLFVFEDGVWKLYTIDKIEGNYVTFTISKANVNKKFAILSVKEPTSPPTGVDSMLVYMIPAAILSLGVCAVVTKRYLHN